MKWSTAFALTASSVVLAADPNSDRMRSAHAVNIFPRDETHNDRPAILPHEIRGRDVVAMWMSPGGNNAKNIAITKRHTTPETDYDDAATAVAAEYGETTPTSVSGEGDAPAAAGTTHVVKVGGPGGLVYQPDQLLNVPVGDVVVFEFYAKNHSVTQSAFDKPCEPIEGGMDSGFMPNPDNSISPPPRFAVKVKVSTPLWFFCRQNTHCGKGMTFSLNPTEEKTQAMFQSMAIQQNGQGASSNITDGGDKPLTPPPDAVSPSSEAAPPPPTDAASPPSDATAAPPSDTIPPSDSVAQSGKPGQGNIGADGSCHCVAVCSVNGFPSPAQGIGAYGGYPGTLYSSIAL